MEIQVPQNANVFTYKCGCGCAFFSGIDSGRVIFVTEEANNIAEMKKLLMPATINWEFTKASKVPRSKSTYTFSSEFALKGEKGKRSTYGGEVYLQVVISEKTTAYFRLDSDKEIIAEVTPV